MQNFFTVTYKIMNNSSSSRMSKVLAPNVVMQSAIDLYKHNFIKIQTLCGWVYRILFALTCKPITIRLSYNYCTECLGFHTTEEAAGTFFVLFPFFYTGFNLTANILAINVMGLNRNTMPRTEQQCQVRTGKQCQKTRNNACK